MRSTNNTRYIASPSSAIIEPLQSQKVDIVVQLSESDFQARRDLLDRFAIYYIVIDDPNVTKANVEQYVKKNEQK